MTPYLFALLLIVVFISSSVVVHSVELNLSDEPNQLYQVIGSVEKVVWEPQRPFASEVVKLGKPVVLTQTTVDLWNARKEWKPSYLIKQLPKTLTGVKRSTQPILYHYKNDAPLLSILKMNPPTSEKFDMSTKEFFQKIKKINKVHKKDLEGEEDTKTSEEQTNMLYYYLSKNLQEIDSDLKRDLSPNFDWLQASNEGVSSNLWIGAGGVTAHAHYDSFHNFFVQFYGKKKFLLFPPSQWTSLQLHPRLHPFYRQSQLNFSSTFNSWSSQTPPQALEVTLSPGDLLYLPPYWFHHVIAVDLSISINVWSDSEDFTIINSVLKAPLPFEEDWSSLEKAAAVRLYFEELDKSIWVNKQGQCIDEVCSEDTKVIDSESFYCKLFNVRYGKLKGELDSHSTLDFTSCKTLPLPAGFSMKDVERGLNNVVPLIDKLSSTSVKEILVGNFIEDVIAWSVGVQNVSNYLLHCLCANEKIK